MKRVFTGYGKSKELWEELNEYIQRTYVQKVKVIIIGDGVGCIRCGLRHIGQNQFALTGECVDRNGMDESDRKQ